MSRLRSSPQLTKLDEVPAYINAANSNNDFFDRLHALIQSQLFTVEQLAECAPSISRKLHLDPIDGMNRREYYLFFLARNKPRATVHLTRPTTVSAIGHIPIHRYPDALYAFYIGDNSQEKVLYQISGYAEAKHYLQEWFRLNAANTQEEFDETQFKKRIRTWLKFQNISSDIHRKYKSASDSMSQRGGSRRPHASSPKPKRKAKARR